MAMITAPINMEMAGTPAQGGNGAEDATETAGMPTKVAMTGAPTRMDGNEIAVLHDDETVVTTNCQGAIYVEEDALIASMVDRIYSNLIAALQEEEKCRCAHAAKQSRPAWRQSTRKPPPWWTVGWV